MVQLKSLQHRAFFIAGTILPTLAFAAYHQVIFGGPLTLAHTYMATNEHHATGLYGVNLPSLAAYSRILFSPERGFALYAALLLPAIYFTAASLRAPEHRTIKISGIIIFITLLTINAGYSADWKSGVSWGPRYLIPAFSIFAFGLTEWCNNPRWKFFFFPAACACIVIHTLAAGIPFDRLEIKDGHFPLGNIIPSLLDEGFMFPPFELIQQFGLFNFQSIVGQILLVGYFALTLALIWLYFKRVQRHELSS